MVTKKAGVEYAIVSGLTKTPIQFSGIPRELSNLAQMMLGSALGSRFERAFLEIGVADIGMVGGQPVEGPAPRWDEAYHGAGDRALADLVLDQLEGAGPVAADAELAAFLGRAHQEGIVEERLRDRQVARLAVQLDREVVDLLDGIGVPELDRLPRIALRVLLAVVELGQHEALEKADRR